MSARLQPAEQSRTTEDIRRDIAQHALEDETRCVQHLLHVTAPIEALDTRARARAAALISHQRGSGHSNMIEAFLHDYGLSTQEGIAMLCLAEALLRIPDSHTADSLIEDTFATGNWREHLGKSESSLVNASTWALMITGSVVNMGQEDSLASWFGSLVKRSGEPVIRQALRSAMKVIGGQFVMGESLSEAIDHARAAEKNGYMMSYDILGEGARSQPQAEGYVRAYMEGIAAVAKGRSGHWAVKPGISIKLSALHPRYQNIHRDLVMSELLPRLKNIILEAKKHDIAVSLDAEEANRLDIELDLYEALLRDGDFAGFDGIGFVLQAYQKRAFYVLDFLAQLARETGKRIPLRLVKGAYWDSEIKHAQIMGLPGYPVFTYKPYTDLSYLACAQKMLHHADLFYAQFASHNAVTVATILEMAELARVAPERFEFQRLHGMGESLHAQLIAENFRSRVYAPVGEHKDLLAYLIRRMLENGANTSFVHLLMDRDTPVDALTQSPITLSRDMQCKPAENIALPADIYGATRKNSRGADLGYRDYYAALETALSAEHAKPYRVPADAAPGEVDAAFSRARAAYPGWSDAPVSVRAACLRKAADALEEDQARIFSVLMREGKKTIYDCIAELREAVDFLRYYADEAERIGAPQTMPGPTGESNVLSLHGRGVWVAISPWNFPLAIFIGQVAAALVTGNAVIAKPAEQTPAIAAIAVEALHQAGIGRDVLQLMCGAGETLGAALVNHPQVAGVVFTGSTQVAKIIQRSLAAKDGPIVPLIAETGGLNAMVIDSSALIEQAVDDILVSAFGSAGQRCSALRLVCVQEEIAPALRTLLCDAMDCLRVGSPLKFSTDVAAVIDGQAQQTLLAHIDATRRTARWSHSAPLAPEIAGSDSYVAPHVFGLETMAQLKEEQFGPVLHMVSFKAKELAALIEAIHASGYGLTFGLHSRLPSQIDHFMRRMHIGNRYVNRSMIGAVVGVQPFGGEGLSGTGPKAGGPHYLPRFCAERTTTINTAAIGGNLDLLR